MNGRVINRNALRRLAEGEPPAAFLDMDDRDVIILLSSTLLGVTIQEEFQESERRNNELE